MDRLDRLYMEEQQKEANAEKQGKLDAAGDVLQDMNREIVTERLSELTRLPPKTVEEIVDSINETGGKLDRFGQLPDAKYTVAEAVKPHLPAGKDAFIKNVAQEVGGFVEKGMKELTERAEKPKADGALEGSKFATGGGDDPKTESPRRDPSKGPGGR